MSFNWIGMLVIIIQGELQHMHSETLTHQICMHFLSIVHFVLVTDNQHAGICLRTGTVYRNKSW